VGAKVDSEAEPKVGFRSVARRSRARGLPPGGCLGEPRQQQPQRQCLARAQAQGYRLDEGRTWNGTCPLLLMMESTGPYFIQVESMGSEYGIMTDSPSQLGTDESLFLGDPVPDHCPGCLPSHFLGTVRWELPHDFGQGKEEKGINKDRHVHCTIFLAVAFK